MAEATSEEGVVVNMDRLESVVSQQMQVAEPVSGKKVELDLQRLDSMKRGAADEPKMIKTSWTQNSCSIHRVPFCFRKDNEGYFVPQLISIGPFNKNRRSTELQAMEEHKRRYLHSILSREGEECLDLFWVAVKKSEERARASYSEEFNDLDSDSFSEMMVMDGCFIIELFHRMCNEEKSHEKYEDDPILKIGWIRKQLSIDLLMLENQIPFFILEDIFKLMKNSSCSVLEYNSSCSVLEDKSSCSVLEDMALFFFSSFFPTGKSDSGHYLHLLHLLQSSLQPPAGNEIHNKNKMKGVIEKVKSWKGHKSLKHSSDIRIIPCASQLQSVGIRFKEKEAKSFLDITFETGVFSRGVIQIPPLTISDVTGLLFLNLVAFEQSYRHCKSYISAYIVFLDCLIGSVDDVGILFNSGINNSYGCNQSMVTLVNKIGSVLILEEGDFYLLPAFDEINKYYRNIMRNRLRASFIRSFLKSPWAVISVFTVIFFQILTVVRSFLQE